MAYYRETKDWRSPPLEPAIQNMPIPSPLRQVPASGLSHAHDYKKAGEEINSQHSTRPSSPYTQQLDHNPCFTQGPLDPMTNQIRGTMNYHRPHFNPPRGPRSACTRITAPAFFTPQER